MNELKDGQQDPDQKGREALSTLIILVAMAIMGFCGYCIYLFLKMVIEGIAAGLSQLGTLAISIIVPIAGLYVISTPQGPPDAYSLAAPQIDQLLSVVTVVSWVVLGAAVIALIGLAAFVVMAVWQHIRDQKKQ